SCTWSSRVTIPAECSLACCRSSCSVCTLRKSPRSVPHPEQVIVSAGRDALHTGHCIGDISSWHKNRILWQDMRYKSCEIHRRRGAARCGKPYTRLGRLTSVISPEVWGVAYQGGTRPMQAGDEHATRQEYSVQLHSHPGRCRCDGAVWMFEQ